MATEQEELRLTVTLIDNASAGLDKLKDSLKEIGGGGSGGGNRHIQKFNDETKSLTENIKKMGGEVGEAFKGLGMFRLGLLGGIGGLAAFGAEVKKQMVDLAEYTDKLRGVNQAARQIGVDPGQLKNIIEQFKAVGVSGDTAVSSIDAISAKIAELQRSGSQLRLDLMRQAGQDPQAQRNMEDYLNRLTHAKTLAEELNVIRKGGEDVYQNALRQHFSEQEAANRRNRFWQMQGYDAQLLALNRAKELSKEEQERENERISNAKVYSDAMGDVLGKWDTLVEHFKSPLFGPDSPFLWTLKQASALLDKINNDLEQHEARVKEADKVAPAPEGFWSKLNPWNQRNIDRERIIEPGLHPEKSIEENTKKLDESTKAQREFIDAIKNGYTPMSYSGGGIGGGGGIIPAAYHPDGGGPFGPRGGGGARFGSAEYPNLGQSTGDGGGRSGGGAPYGSDTGGATGTPSSGPAGDPSVPSEVLDKAKAVALHSGPGGVEAFMRNQGYPKAGNWCGEFAASVVKSAGGTPPKNPAIASNWRNWGTEVDTPQPGDVAVRRGARTGATGSHVTFVEGVNAKGGTFTGLGGNQGAWESTQKTGRYQFFRGGMPNGQTAGAGTGAGAGSTPVNEAIRSTAGTAGMDEAHWKAIAGIESGLDPSSNANRSTQYKGLFQIGTRGADSEWARRGQGSPYDAQANAEAAAKLASDNNAWFKGKYGRDPTPTETYMMHQQGRGFYSHGSMTNIGGNPYPGMRGPQTHESFEAGWGREIERRAARNQLDGSQVASTRVEGTGKLTVDVNAPKGTNVGAEGGGLFKKVEMNRQTQMSPARRGPEGGYATESML